MKRVFKSSLNGVADILLEQLQLAKDTAPGYSVQVRSNWCIRTEWFDEDKLVHSVVDC